MRREPIVLGAIDHQRVQRVLNAERKRMSNLSCRMSDVESPILYFGSQISDLRCWMSDFESRMWDVGHQFSDVNCRIFNLGCRISDVQSRMTDGNYKRP